MDLKRIFNDNKAVSPVIGVVLMVAITVILAAAIGSSVFGKGPAESGPQANINAKFANFNDTNVPQNITIEHLGGDSLSWSTTKVFLYDVNGKNIDLDTRAGNNSTTHLNVGDTETFKIKNSASIEKNTQYNVKVVDSLTNQLICDKKIRT